MDTGVAQTQSTAEKELEAPALRIDIVLIDSVTPDPANVRRHPDANLAAIRASLRRFGQQKPIVVDSNRVIRAGNGTWQAAKAEGWTTIAVVVSDLPPAELTAFAIADNRTSELAEWDDAALFDQLRALEAEGVPAMDLGFDERALRELANGLPLDGLPGDVEPTDPPENPVSVPGELYELGPHRLLCGDSTNAEEVARLMAGEKATLLATDPPYLVNYDGTNHGYITPEHRARAKETGDPNYGGKRWDDYNEGTATLFHDFLAVALPHLTPQALIYQWHASRRQVLVEQAWKDNGLLVHQTIIWSKKRPVLTRSHFLWTYEPCFYGWVEGNQPPHDRRPPSTARNVWELDTKDLDVTGVHPTQKPLEVCLWPIQWHTRRDEICFEPFAGSGTCLIAAAMEGRRCYALEMSPAFCDVIRRRWTTWARLAGQNPGPGALE